MKKSEFLSVLEAFPGRMQLKNQSKEELISLYAGQEGFIDIYKKSLRERNLFFIPQNEELWYKLLAFLTIEFEVLVKREDLDGIPSFSEERFFSEKSKKTHQTILERFNYMLGSQELVNIGGITLDELIQFAQSGEDLFL